MEQYIKKSALVEEIEKRRKNWWYGSSIGAKYKREECDDILSFLDTLEVKEVDLNKELSYEDYKGFFKKYPNLSDDWGFDEAWIFANYFFELGLKAQKGEYYENR